MKYLESFGINTNSIDINTIKQNQKLLQDTLKNLEEKFKIEEKKFTDNIAKLLATKFGQNLNEEEKNELEKNINKEQIPLDELNKQIFDTKRSINIMETTITLYERNLPHHKNTM